MKHVTYLRTILPILALIGNLHALAAPAAGRDDDAWVESMKKVHARFTGTPGTFAHFGDSITVTMAFWTPLANDPKNLDAESARLYERVKAYQRPDCWSKWKGSQFGNTGSMTIRWAHDNVDKWLQKLNPEVVLLMFGTNDLGQLDLKEYEQKTREVVERCLKNGSIVILTTIPPRHGHLDKAKTFAEATRKIAADLKLPLVDYQAEILKRRPDDWDGALPKFKDIPGDEYNVPTLLARDGVHPSNPRDFRDYSEKSLNSNGYVLRNYLTLVAYGKVVGKVLEAELPGGLRRAVSFYASFDEAVKADVAGGARTLDTRMNHETEKGKFVFEKGFNEKVFRIAAKKGVAGGALEAVDVLPRNGRVFFPAKDNLAFKKGGWGGAVSMWVNTDPNKLLKTTFCDPIQITQKGANNGGIWFDFNNAKPRDLRMGTFPAVAEGQQPIKEEDPKAPMVPVKGIGFKEGEWHHVVLTWNNFDTGKTDATASLYIDGKLIGTIKDRAIAMDWDLDKTGIYTAVSYIGLLDEMALFNRPLTEEEIVLLHREPGLLTALKKLAKEDNRPASLKFPFEAAAAGRYQKEYADWLGLPVEWTSKQGMKFVLVPPGTFLMGSPKEEPGHGSGGYEETQHSVTLTRPFYLGKHEVTVGQFRRFVEATGYKTDGEKNGGGTAHDAKADWKHRPGTSWLKPGYAGPYEMRDDHPVVHVSHTDAREYCAWLQKQGSFPTDRADEYALPGEAQWEWACRAGSGTTYWWGSDEDTTGKVINVGDRTLKRVHPEWPRKIMPMDDGHAFCAPVGSYRPNAFGLHDMLGNVWEFCGTHYGPYPREAVTDPGDGDPKRGFAVRGGGWSNLPTDARCASRNADPPHFCHSNLGFRVMVSIEERGSGKR